MKKKVFDLVRRKAFNYILTEFVECMKLVRLIKFSSTKLASQSAQATICLFFSGSWVPDCQSQILPPYLCFTSVRGWRQNFAKYSFTYAPSVGRPPL
jgi:hypothetical protein